LAFGDGFSLLARAISVMPPPIKEAGDDRAWDEERSPDVAFCFKVWEAAFAFMVITPKPTFHTEKDEDSVGHWRASGSRCKIVARLKVDRD
jgi:hypothetical protein